MDIETLYQHFLQSSGVCTDTRKIQENCIFIGIKGDNFNGNHFAQEALDKGARLAIIEEEAYHKNPEKTFLVADTITTLQDLARYHRQQLGTPIIALTGSNGKTTTKELFHAVLSQKYKTMATVGNLNNHLGVPFTLLSLTPETEIGIVEMGANHLGEIETLSNIALPDYGYVTNFGRAHLEGFGGIQGVIKGKTELYRHLREHNKKLFVNGRDELQIAHSEHMDRKVFGPSDSDYPVELISADDSVIVEFDGTQIQSHLTGIYNFENIAAAIAVGAFFNVPTEDIKAGIEGYKPTNLRSQIIHKESNTILMDAYNANPSSMMAALENFKKNESKNKVLCLGDMFELGESAAEEHQNIVDYLEKNFMGRTYLVGQNFSKTFTENPYIEKFATFDEFQNELKNNPPSNAYIFVKGSRSMQMERVLDLI